MLYFNATFGECRIFAMHFKFKSLCNLKLDLHNSLYDGILGWIIYIYSDFSLTLLLSNDFSNCAKQACVE